MIPESDVTYDGAGLCVSWETALYKNWFVCESLLRLWIIVKNKGSHVFCFIVLGGHSLHFHRLRFYKAHACIRSDR